MNNFKDLHGSDFLIKWEHCNQRGWTEIFTFSYFSKRDIRGKINICDYKLLDPERYSDHLAMTDDGGLVFLCQDVLDGEHLKIDRLGYKFVWAMSSNKLQFLIDSKLIKIWSRELKLGRILK